MTAPARPCWSFVLGISGPSLAALFFMLSANFGFKVGDSDTAAQTLLGAWLLGCLAWLVGVIGCFRGRFQSLVGWVILGAMGGPVLASAFGVIMGAWTQEGANLSGWGQSHTSIPKAAAGAAFLCVVFLGWIVAVPGLICGIVTAVWMRRRSSSLHNEPFT